MAVLGITVAKLPGIIVFDVDLTVQSSEDSLHAPYLETTIIQMIGFSLIVFMYN